MSTSIRNRDAHSTWAAVCNSPSQTHIRALLAHVETSTIQARVEHLDAHRITSLERDRLRAELIRRAALPVKEMSEQEREETLDTMRAGYLAIARKGRQCRANEASIMPRCNNLAVVDGDRCAFHTRAALPRKESGPNDSKVRRFAYLGAPGTSNCSVLRCANLATFGGRCETHAQYAGDAASPDITRPRGAESDPIPQPWRALSYSDQAARIATDLMNAREALNRTDRALHNANRAQKIALKSFSELQIEQAVHEALGTPTKNRRDN